MTGAGEARPEAPRRCGFVAVIGAPNAGKSTLTNRLVGAKVSIVTARAQTTRCRVMGVAAAGESQLVYVDTPGVFEPRRRLDRAMVAAAWSAAAAADVVMPVIDARTGFDAAARRVLAGFQPGRRGAALVLNKIDLVARGVLLPLARAAAAARRFDAVFMVSALSGDGVDDVAAYLAGVAPEGPWMFPEDHISDMNERLFAAEVTREKLFERLHRELPYALAVETEGWEPFEDGSLRIAQTVFVERDSQKGIVLGRGGALVRAAREAAMEEMAALFGRRIHLVLFVKVRRRWSEDPERYRSMGLDYGA